jgi:hypothetical protein
MARRTAGRRPASALTVPIEGRPDFAPTDYATPPAAGWTAETLWSAGWRYADEHADGRPGVALRAFRDAARAYDRARHLAPTSTRAVVRQDIEARLQGVDYARTRPEEAFPF